MSDFLCEWIDRLEYWDIYQIDAVDEEKILYWEGENGRYWMWAGQSEQPGLNEAITWHHEQMRGQSKRA
jgi:hypothetical protein